MMDKFSIHSETRQRLIKNFPLAVLQMVGKDAVDFLQRITTNDFHSFKKNDTQKTLLITEKGKLIDAVWVLHRGDDLLLMCNDTLGNEVLSWLNKFIIMENIQLKNISDQFSFDLILHPENDINVFCQIDYFGVPAGLILHGTNQYAIPPLEQSFEQWRIERGIPALQKKLAHEFNPLELNLWDWISFTKGCYIGQEVIARLDTYNKVQRTLCLISSKDEIVECEKLVDEEKKEIGTITNVTHIESESIGLAVVRLKYAVNSSVLRTESGKQLTIEKAFYTKKYGRN